MKLFLLIALVLLASVPHIKAQGDEEIIEDEYPEEVYPEGEEEFIEEEEKPEPEPEDPCIGVECGYGKECAANEEGEGICKCIQNCRHKAGYGERFQVCSNQNETFANKCDMESQKCMCEGREEGCRDAKFKNAELKHFGRCRAPLECPAELLANFAERMRGWLRNVLMSMAANHDLSQSEFMMAREAAQSDRAEITPVLWKFCNLDQDPSDGQISQRELLPMLAQLYPLEDCSETFFKNCDGDGNKDISLKEFGSCMGLADADIKDRCKDIVVDETEEGPEPGFLKEGDEE